MDFNVDLTKEQAQYIVVSVLVIAAVLLMFFDIPRGGEIQSWLIRAIVAKVGIESLYKTYKIVRE